jgi:hypothetical protein
MRVFGVALVVACFAACSPAPIGDYPEEGDIQLPNRRNDVDEGADTNAGDETSPAGNTFTLTVTLGGPGTGAVTSSPNGLTCQGKTCTGTFASGTAVTLQASPAAGSFFVGWSGSCNGTSTCAATMNGDVAVNAELESLVGTWSGTYTNTRQAFGCTFNNKGDLSITFAADGTAFSSTGNVSGLELRQRDGCNVVGSTTGTAPKEATNVAGAALTGTWTFNVQGADGTLAFPYTGTVAGKKLSGSWTCATCVGSFMLTKQ